jgi:opacity protein-like surface antigen
MKRFLFLAALAATFGLSAVAASQAAVVTNTTIPISGTVVNPCNGELVPFTGDLHLLFRVTFDQAGGLHVGVHEDIQATGVGATTGAKYELNAVLNEEVNYGFVLGGNGAAEETIVESELFVAQGSAPNFVLKLLEHITITPDGTVRVLNIDFDTECRG